MCSSRDFIDIQTPQTGELSDQVVTAAVHGQKLKSKTLMRKLISEFIGMYDN